VQNLNHVHKLIKPTNIQMNQSHSTNIFSRKTSIS